MNALRDPGRQYGQGPRVGQRVVHGRGGDLGLLYGVAGDWPSGLIFVAVAIAIAVTPAGSRTSAARR